MDFMLALNVTIYGLGIVFLALLILMFSIMVLSKLFSVATGKEILVAPGPTVRQAPQSAPAAAPLPTPAAAPGAPMAATAVPVAAPSAPLVLKMGFGGKQHKVELKDITDLAATVVVDGSSFRVERDRTDVKRVVVNGTAHTIEVKEVTDSSATVVIDGASQKVELSRETPVVPSVAPSAMRVVKKKRVVSGAIEQITAPLPGKILSVAVKPGDNVKAGDEVCVIEAMKMGNSIKAQREGTVKEVLISAGQSVGFGAPLIALATGAVVEEEVEELVPVEGVAAAAVPASENLKIGIAGKQHQVELKAVSETAWTVAIGGASFQVERDRAESRRVVVNGMAHTVEVKETVGNTATLVVDGVSHKVEVVRQPAAAPAAVAAPAPVPAPVPAAAPSPAAAPAPVPPTEAPAAGEQVTAPLPGKILSVAVQPGAAVNKGDELCVIEAMKMGNSIKAQRAGTIKQVLVSPGQTVGFGTPLVVME